MGSCQDRHSHARGPCRSERDTPHTGHERLVERGTPLHRRTWRKICEMVCSSAKSDVAHGISIALGLLCSGSRSASSTEARAAVDGTAAVASNPRPAREIGGSAWFEQHSWQ